MSKGHEDIMTTWGFIDLFFPLVTSCALKVTVWAAASVFLLSLFRIHLYGHVWFVLPAILILLQTFDVFDYSRASPPPSV